MKRYFIIDLENIGKHFTEGIEDLTMEDTLIICHNRVVGNLSKDIQDKLYHTKATVKMLEIFNHTKNAMDFCLCTQLGFLIAENSNKAKYYIVSNDKGFETAMDFAKSLNGNVTVKRITSLKAEQESVMYQEEEKRILTNLLPEYNKKAIGIAQRCLDNAKSVADYHNLLQKNLYDSQVRDIYLKTRHLLVTA